MSNEEIAGMAVKLSMESGTFKEQIDAINREMKVVESNFKATGNTAKNFGESIEGLEANWQKSNDLLKLQNKALELYQQKVDNAKDALVRNAKEHTTLENAIKDTKDALEESEREYGKNSDEAQKLNSELKDLKESLAKNEQLIRNSQKTLDNSTATYNNAKAKVHQYEQQLLDTEKALENFGKTANKVENVNKGTSSSFSSMQVALGNLVANGIQTCVQAFQQLMEESFEYAEQLTKFNDMTGMSIESLGQYDAILSQTGGSLDTLTGSVMDFNERMYDAAQGTGDGFEIFNKLGISVVDAQGSLRATEDVLEETIYSLQNWGNESERTAMATTLLSTGAEELSGVLKMTNEELKVMKDNTKVLSEDDVKSIQGLNSEWKAFQQTLNVELMGLLSEYCGDFGEQLEKVSDAILGVITLLDTLQPYLTRLKDYAQWLPTNWVPNALSSGLGWVHETFGDATDATDESMKSIKSELEDTAETAKDSFSEVAESVSDSMNGAEEEISETLGVISGVLDDYYDDNLKDYEKYLNEKNGMDLDGQMKTAMELKDYEETQNRQKEKQLERYGDIYTKDLKKSNTTEEEKTRITIAESNKRIEQYNKEAQAFSKTNNPNANNNSVNHYATGTQYHLGGMAIVGENGPELVALPRGTSVKTAEQTRDILRESNNNTNNSTTNNITLNVTTNDPQEIIRALEDYTRLK